MIVSILLLLLALTILIAMIITDRTILYVKMRKEKWVFAPTREEDPVMFWLFIISEIFLISYLLLDYLHGFAGFWK